MIWLIIYMWLMVFLALPAHRTVYPLIGDGHPLIGVRRLVVYVFSPFILLGIALWRAPTFARMLITEANRK